MESKTDINDDMTAELLNVSEPSMGPAVSNRVSKPSIALKVYNLFDRLFYSPNKVRDWKGRTILYSFRLLPLILGLSYLLYNNVRWGNVSASRYGDVITHNSLCVITFVMIQQTKRRMVKDEKYMTKLDDWL